MKRPLGALALVLATLAVANASGCAKGTGAELFTSGSGGDGHGGDGGGGRDGVGAGTSTSTGMSTSTSTTTSTSASTSTATLASSSTGGPACGDDFCAAGETCTNCPGDCGECPPVCGDDSCDAGETCQNCAGDCGPCATCPNGICGVGEDCNTCPQDCGGCLNCAHDLCVQGASLTSGCDPCATLICQVDPFCCDTAWDGTCVTEVSTECGLNCGGGNCSHDLCLEGIALVSGCDPCVTLICQVDSFCCTNSWDITCVDEVGSECGMVCF